MSQSSLNHLKLYQEEMPAAQAPDIDSVASLPEVLAAFQDATGWSLQFPSGPKPTCPNEYAWSAPANPGVGTSLGHATLVPACSASAAPGRSDSKSAERLASALAGMTEELLATQRAVWEREAELATAVPVSIRPVDAKHLAERLTNLLGGVAEAVNCQAAGLYLLDDGTTSLKLRSSWGLPPRRLLDPPRPLRGAKADLEAMIGHAVVIEDAQLLGAWQSPEASFASAACVPVTSSTNILGSLWVFSATRREFGRQDATVLELAAGRIAAGLEREVLSREASESVRWKRAMADGERLQRDQSPGVAPVLDGWDVAGWVPEDQGFQSAFFDWFPMAGGLVGIASGAVESRAIAGAISVGVLRAALRSHAQYGNHAGRLLDCVHGTVSAASRGDQTAALFCSVLESRTDCLRYSAAGPLGLLQFGPKGWRDVSRSSPPLGDDGATPFRQYRCRFQPGDLLVVLSSPFPVPGSEKSAGSARKRFRHMVANAYGGRTGLSSKELVLVARDLLERRRGGADQGGESALVIKRTGP